MRRTTSGTRRRRTTCPVEQTLAIIGKKWTLLIIRDLLTGTKRFGELMTSLNGISPRTLSIRLDELEEDGIIDKKAFPVVPPRVDYTLTARGRALHEIIDQMAQWGKKAS